MKEIQELIENHIAVRSRKVIGLFDFDKSLNFTYVLCTVDLSFLNPNESCSALRLSIDVHGILCVQELTFYNGREYPFVKLKYIIKLN